MIIGHNTNINKHITCKTNNLGIFEIIWLVRRKDRAVKDIKLKEAIINKARVCRLGLCDNGQPYVVPLCFGYNDKVIYFHSASAGHKIDIIKRNNRVCVEFDLDGALEVKKTTCSWGIHFQSVIAFGIAELVESNTEKRKGLDLIMAHYHHHTPVYSDKALATTTVIKIIIEKMTSKRG